MIIGAMKHVAVGAVVALSVAAVFAQAAAAPQKQGKMTYDAVMGVYVDNSAKDNLECDEAYECDFVVMEKTTGDLYEFNLNGLCALEDYTSDSIKYSNGNVSFNICGFSNRHCLPANNPNVPYIRGVAIQYWGPPSAAEHCTIPGTGKSEECTRDCEVIGIGEPSFELIEPSNPEQGGIRLAHRAAIAAKDDPWECVVERGGESFALERHVTYDIYCDETVPLAKVIGAEEHPECHYQVTIRSQHACGKRVRERLVPKSKGDKGGDSNNSSGGGSGAGIGAGMFFFGIFMLALVAGGYYWWRNRSSGYSSFGSSAAASTATESSGLRSTGTGGIGSSSL
eukprot:gb/GECG01013327.1/.p1 GENE.gb/GECG01013327.1/~~gb/GECG01013327.1/.p1  ORF type:complete len:339 (+),score=40.58 gb/GECG01013327.1/:1-1017(+)